jgi:hypothetical protein
MLVARTKSFQLNVRIAPSLKLMLDAAASADRRSLASLIDKVLIEYLREHGFVDEVGRPTRKGNAAIDASGEPAGKRK